MQHTEKEIRSDLDMGQVVVGAERALARFMQCLSSLPQAQFNSDGSQERPLLEPEVLHVLAPPFFSGPSTEGSAVRSHGRKRWSLHRMKRNQPPSAAGALGQGTFSSSYRDVVDLQESVFPVLHHLSYDSRGN